MKKNLHSMSKLFGIFLLLITMTVLNFSDARADVQLKIVENEIEEEESIESYSIETTSQSEYAGSDGGGIISAIIPNSSFFIYTPRCTGQNNFSLCTPVFQVGVKRFIKYCSIVVYA